MGVSLHISTSPALQPYKDTFDMESEKPPSKEIAACKEKIKKGKPRQSKVGDVQGILAPSDRKHWQKIRFFQRMSNPIRKKFREGNVKIPEQSLQLSKEGKRGKGNTIGREWDDGLSQIIQLMKEGSLSSVSERPELQLLKAISKEFKIQFLDSQFPLYGYMYSKTEKQPKVYYWEGDTDAIGWYKDPKSGEGRYVIVDWKVLGDIATFWLKNPDAYGRYLHQCLVYARLLQLHMELKSLPYILIVPISAVTGKDFHPALFYNYPEECTEFIESFEWSVTFPEEGIPVQIPLENPFNTQKLKPSQESDQLC